MSKMSMKLSTLGIFQLISIFFFSFCSLLAVAEPHIEGASKELNVVISRLNKYVDDEIVWQTTINHSGARFLRVEFLDIQNDISHDYEILVRDPNYNLVFRYSRAEFAKEASFWTGIIPGDSLTIQVLGKAEPPSGLRFKIGRLIYQATGPQVLSQIGETNEEEPITPYLTDPKIRRLANSVAKLSFIVSGKPFACTGFMVSDDELITNYHCVATSDVCATTWAFFGYDSQGVQPKANQNSFRCLAVKKADSDLDYAMLKIDQQPGKAAKWGHVSLDARAPKFSETLLMIEHPSGLPKRIVRRNCNVTSPSTYGENPLDQSDFGHSCDSRNSSSGSPLFDTEFQVIGIHHKGLSPYYSRIENRAVQIKRIAPYILANFVR